MNSKTKKLKNNDKNSDVSTDESNIQKFFAGKTVFLTGSTGFLGQCIVEKLLRGCPDLNKLYMLVRPKRGMSVSERLKKFFNLEIFDLLREN
ncbi:putative fatty acyl-CoA reductase CG5065 [Cephus cinctus]|uniref:Fatty acyl-CoA reductase n=1 Tax=Cephus cinctus TaxID=211228 RepID=A0AAJ7BZ13_CEPCN|nr:putative fatty acyl-CoA reductase CG5065 [Cephus cinctus]